MERAKKFGKVLGIVLGVAVVAAAVFYGWASWKTSSVLAQTFEAHSIDFPVPFPLTDAEIEALRQERLAELEAAAPAPTEADGETAAGDGEAVDAEAEGEDAGGETEAAGDADAEPTAPPVDPLEGVDLEAIALERAVERGRHLVTARYACIECHGDDFSGGTMVDDPAIGTLLGPNLTGGAGSRVGDWSIADWDRAVRHGIFPDGGPSAMPAEDYQRMSDRELSDIIAYIRSFPAVDNEVTAVSLGPLGTVLMATGNLPLSVERIADHRADHPRLPPDEAPTVEFGEHLAGVCTGCHREHFEGGPIPAGPPDWVPARNLTPHEQGLASWSYDDFVAAMREMRRPDGTELGMPMTLMRRYTANMTETELQALWAYIQSIEPRPTGT